MPSPHRISQNSWCGEKNRTDHADRFHPAGGLALRFWHILRCLDVIDGHHPVLAHQVFARRRGVIPTAECLPATSFVDSPDLKGSSCTKSAMEPSGPTCLLKAVETKGGTIVEQKEFRGCRFTTKLRGRSVPNPLFYSFLSQGHRLDLRVNLHP